MTAKIRNALTLYRPLGAVENIEIRLHRTVLYNSIYRADDQLLVNQHAYGIPAAQAPIFCLSRTDSGTWRLCILIASSACGPVLRRWEDADRRKTAMEPMVLQPGPLPANWNTRQPADTRFEALPTPGVVRCMSVGRVRER